MEIYEKNGIGFYEMKRGFWKLENLGSRYRKWEVKCQLYVSFRIWIWELNCCILSVEYAHLGKIVVGLRSHEKLSLYNRCTKIMYLEVLSLVIGGGWHGCVELSCMHYTCVDWSLYVMKCFCTLYMYKLLGRRKVMYSSVWEEIGDVLHTPMCSYIFNTLIMYLESSCACTALIGYTLICWVG